jgi:hypothetical protein
MNSQTALLAQVDAVKQVTPHASAEPAGSNRAISSARTVFFMYSSFSGVQFFHELPMKE